MGLTSIAKACDSGLDMHEQNLAIIKGLVSVAWADGKVAAEEMEVIEGLLSAFGASRSDACEIRMFAREPRTIDDIPLTDLSASDRRILLHHAVLITYVDGEQSESERQVLEQLANKLHIPPEEAAQILLAGGEHARSQLSLLGQEPTPKD
jgi:uncharacterized tellurite resistance protein B-like protein